MGATGRNKGCARDLLRYLTLRTIMVTYGLGIGFWSVFPPLGGETAKNRDRESEIWR